MFFKASVISCLLLSTGLTKAQSIQKPGANLVTCKDISARGFTGYGNINTNSVFYTSFKEQRVSKKIQYLDYQYIFGYTLSAKYKSVMNMHPEMGIGIGYKKYHYTAGITGTFRFLKTREPYIYYNLNDTFSTRYFSNLAFAFYFHQQFYHEKGNELFAEIAPGFEILYLERTAKTYNQSRAYAVSFHAMGGFGYRLTTKKMKYYQLTTAINYNNFSYGKATNIQAQIYFNVRFTTGFLVKDTWATKRNYQKAY